MLSHWAGSSPIAAAVQSLFRAGEPSAVFIAQKPSDLLVRKNRVTYSQDFTNAAWSKANATLAFTGATLAPDGTATASKMTEAAINAGHSLTSGNVAVRIGAPVTVSIYAKAAERSQIELQYFDGSANAFPLFDLTTGALLSANGADATTSTSVGNGWWRFTVTKTALAATGNLYAYPCVGGTNGYNGDGTSGIYLWGAQMDVNSSTASAYQPVTDWTTEYLAAVGNLVTQYTDNLGATPVLNLEDTVGLHLDTRPIVLGPELCSGGYTVTATTPWTARNSATLSVVAGALRITNDGTNTNFGGAYQTVTTEVGKRYVCKVGRPLTGVQPGSYMLGNTGQGSTQYAPVGSTADTSFTATTTATTLSLNVGPATAFTTADFNNISIREVVSAPNPVGQPLRGPDLLTNGPTGFSGTTGYVAGNSATLGTSGSSLTIAYNAVANPFAYIDVPTIPGTFYNVTGTLAAVAGAVTNFTVGGGTAGSPSLGSVSRATAGTFTVAFKATASTTSISAIATAVAAGSVQVSILSVKPLYGNHRSQSSAPARARLSARYNKCQHRNANPVDLTGITKGGDALATLTVVSDTAQLAAAGLSGRCTLGNVYKLDNSAGSTLAFAFDNSSVGNLNTQRVSVYARSAGGSGNVQMSGSATGAQTINSPGYQLFQATCTPAAVGNNWQVSAPAGVTILFVLGDMRESCYSYLPAIQTVWDATTGYDDTGFPARLVRSGAQGESTGVVDFSGSDQVQMWAAFTKLNEAATSLLLELGADSTANNGSFGLFAPSAVAGNNINFCSRGTAVSFAANTGFASPFTSVSTGLGNISGDTAVLRVNGVTASTSVSDQGTGNFSATYSLNYGSRNNLGTGAGTLNFTGDEFISIVRGGAVPDANTISYVERFCARYLALTF